MLTSRLQAKLPQIAAWIEQTLAAHRERANPVSTIGFARLAAYYSRETLDAAKIVIVPRVPTPPLTALGLPEFGDFERMDAAGITYLDTFFVRAGRERDESLSFHELVHVVQWRHLGPERFLMAYALGHVLHGGYHANPLEKMAYALQARFETEAAPFSAEPEICNDLDIVVHRLFQRAGVLNASADER